MDRTRKSVTTLLCLSAFGALLSVSAAETPLLAIPGKVIYEASFDKAPAPPWRAPKGQWEAKDGVLRGAELPADNHGAVLRKGGPVPDNVIITYELRFLDGAKGTTLSINDAKEHVCRLLMAPGSFAVQKDDHDHDGPDKAVIFSRQAADLKPGEWHSVRLEIVGDQMLGMCDALVGYGSHELIGKPKANLGFTVTGQSVEFRNFKMVEATLNPEWEKVKATLPKGKPAPAAKGKKK